MKITFLVGNGFDLNLGLHTSYADFYPYFIQHALDDNMIRNWLIEDDLLWSDLEEQLGQKLQEIKQHDREKFYDDKTELDTLLLEYLRQEQRKISVRGKEKAIAEELAKSLKTFCDNLSKNDKEIINITCEKHASERFLYRFISFNYTNTLDQFVKILHTQGSFMIQVLDNGVRRYHLSKEILHIHGTITEEMILGVNDEGQINNAFLSNDSKFLDTFIKKRMNNNIGQGKIEIAKRLIEESHIICIFGMSIGCTDKMWWQEILNWLSASEYNKLIVYYKDINKWNIPARIILARKRVIEQIMKNAERSMDKQSKEKIEKQICISYNSNIFNFSELNLNYSSNSSSQCFIPLSYSIFCTF